jgi:electron transfer flavoprotein alpha subunit
LDREICVFVNHDGQKIDRTSLEAMSAAWHLSNSMKVKLTAIWRRGEATPSGTELGKYGLDCVYFVENDQFQQPEWINISRKAITVLRQVRPRVFIMGDLEGGREIGGRISFELGGSFMPDCVDLKLDANLTLTATRIKGLRKELIECASRSPTFQIASIKEGIFAPHQKSFEKQCQVIPFKCMQLPEEGVKHPFQRIDYIKVDLAKQDLSEARVIVSGGRGVGGPKGFEQIEKLAELLGGAVACSRSVVDLGWLPRDKQVGQSGRTVRPKLYMAIGISGASQHILGMKESENIVAINKDEHASIFEVADLGIVGDLHEVVPMLIDSLKRS